MTSASMPWVKLFTEILDDAKLLPLTEPLKWRFVQLILLAGDCDQDGWLANNMGPIPVETIALRLRASLEQLKRDLISLKASGLMVYERTSNAWMVANFSKRQGRPQSQKRELWREQKNRQRRVRADTGGTPPPGRESVQPLEEEVEEEKDLEKDKEGSADAPPTPASVRIYEESGGKYPTGKLIDGTSKKEHAQNFIVEHVKDTPESLTLWGKVVYAYQVQWSAKSYTVMVNDYYLRGRIPGQSTNSNGHKALAAPVFNPVLTPEQEKLKASMAAHKAKQHANPS